VEYPFPENFFNFQANEFYFVVYYLEKCFFFIFRCRLNSAGKKLAIARINIALPDSEGLQSP